MNRCVSWLLSGSSGAGTWSGLLAGALILVLALARGPIRERYGTWQSWIL